MHIRLRYLLALVFIIFSTTITFGQLSRTHYIPPISTNTDSNDNIGTQFIYVSTPSVTPIGFTITPLGQPASAVFTGTVSKDTPAVYEVDVQGNNSQLHQPVSLTSVITSNKGYIIEAEDLVYVSVRVRQAGNQFHAGALVSKGLSALGTEFRSGGFITQNGTISGHMAYLSVMATEDDTDVTFVVPDGIVVANFNGGAGVTGPINITLDENQSYILAVANTGGPGSGNPDDFIGSLVTSDKPIVVNTGSATGSFGVGGGRDYGIDQIVDASKVGSEYIFVRGDGFDDWENVLIVANQDNTDVFVNGSTIPFITLRLGETAVIEGGFYNPNGNMYVRTSNPVFAYQGIGGLNQSGNPAEPNQGMFFVPPLSCENRGNVDNIAEINRMQPGTDPDDDFDGGVTIVTNRGSVIDIFQDDNPVVINATDGPFDVTGNPDYVTYRLTGLSGRITVESSEELYCAYFNANNAAASGSFYSGFPTPPEINFNTNIAALGNCIPNVTLQSLNTDLFDSVEWFYDDGVTGFVSTGNITGTLVPTLPGNYKLIGTLTCSGATFESQTIPVSLCPDDLDGDLIIDNLDVDLDNDGIANCDESQGNVILDFTDTNQPILNFLDSSTNNTFITTTTTPVTTETIVGDNNSNFTTTVNSGISVGLDYTLAFNAPSNIEFTQTIGATHTSVDGETFILVVGPNSKNITLVDPDDILLIDTDFDDVFETGVTAFNSSEVRFRFNPTPNGTTPFRLVANSIDEIAFRHLLSNATDGSSFEGNIILTCFATDTDGDGIEDALDADSDNDGIPDVIEAQGTNFVLSGNDADLDGLDDIFGGAFVTPIDSDNDGIPDTIDLDSDNDGVYDLFEAGHGLADADLDGRIDNATALVGINGWVDALETAPDSFLLGYTIADPDGDILFSYLDFESDGDLCPDVIEAGYADPDGDNIIGTSPVTVDTEGKVTGIPDGYTVPNSDYSTNAPILLNTPFEDVAFCEESTSTITIDSTADTFQWEVSTDGGVNWTDLANDATYSGVTTTSLQITSIPLTFDQNQYRVFLQRAGNSCDDTSNPIILTVEPLPIITSVVQLLQCDDDTDGFSAFNLNEAASDISDNFVNETFVFYESLSDAQTNTDPIAPADALAYTNQTVTTDTVWARAISNFGCFRIAQVNLVVSTTGLPMTFQRNFETCDDFLDIDGNDNINNDDTDGVSTFDFSSVTPEVVNQFPATQQLTVTYYRNQADALAETNVIIDPSNYRNIGYPNTQQIYIRVDSNLDNDCLGFGPFITLTVDPVPLANTVGVDNLELCDNGDDGIFDNGIVQTFNLDQQTPLILGTQSAADYTVTYHTSATDALDGFNAITNTGVYENITANQQTIFVRVTNNTTGCFTNHTSFDLIVNPLPVANFVEDLEICDTINLPIDGSAQNGFSTQIDLELQTPGILGTQDPTQFSVTYHASLNDAQAGDFPLSSLFTNTVAFSQIIYVRVFNADTGCANGISNFNVIVNPEPTTENVSNLSYCDDDLDGDDTNGFVQNIDLDSQILDILGPLQDEDDFTVTFHERPEDATDGMNPLSSPYSNTTPNQQTIYVRVLNNDTGCFNDDFTFDVIVNPLPVFRVTSPQIVCLNGPSLVLTVEDPAAVYDYVWTDPVGNMIIGSQITVTSGGLYTVTGSTTDGTTDQNGVACTRTREIQVDESIIATITDQDVAITDDLVDGTDQNNFSITIDPTNLGIGDYEYALTDENGLLIRTYQDDTTFENIEGGFYTLFVRDKNGCGVAELDISVVQFPKFFTPNNDGVNDTWAIKGANSSFFPNSQVHIFNRFGKVVAKINIDNPGWNGTYNGKTLPSDDYWFSIQLTHRDGRVIDMQGNFSLLRREN